MTGSPSIDDALEILHWNVHSWTDVDDVDNSERVAAAIEETDVDVAALVEVDEPMAGESPLGRVASRLSMRAVYVPSFEFGNQDAAQGSFGNAILTRLPILGVRHHQLLWPPRVFDGSEPSEPRSLLLVLVDTPSGPCWVGSTHLPRADRYARDAALVRALDIMTGLRHRWILAGDFNIPADAWIGARPDLAAVPSTPTYPADQPVECIDYVISPRSTAVSAEVLKLDGSDHRPMRCSARPGSTTGRPDLPTG